MGASRRKKPPHSRGSGGHDSGHGKSPRRTLRRPRLEIDDVREILHLLHLALFANQCAGVGEEERPVSRASFLAYNCPDCARHIRRASPESGEGPRGPKGGRSARAPAGASTAFSSSGRTCRTAPSPGVIGPISSLFRAYRGSGKRRRGRPISRDAISQ